MADDNGGTIAAIPAATTTATDTPQTTSAATPAGDAAQAAAAPAAPASTTLATGAVPDKPAAAPATWPDNWRQLLAGEDKGKLKQLERFTAPADIYKSYEALQARMSSGQVKTALPADATPEQTAAWRKENGVPDDPAGYKPDLPNGIVPGEADKPLLDGFAKFVHGKNWTPSQYNEALSWYYSTQDQIKAQQDEVDSTYKSQSEDKLRQEWGGDFKKNLNAVKSLFAGAPADLYDQVMGGRLGNGRKIGDDPVALGFLASISREMNPAATLLPPGLSNPGKGLDDEIKQIETDMRIDRNAYFKDAAKQARYGELLGAREKMKARG